jgi:O-methyltransferase
MWPFRSSARTLFHQLLPKRGLQLLRLGVEQVTYPPDFTDADVRLCETVAPYTMTSPERLVSLSALVKHVVVSGIPGSIVECGVWRGGSMMVAARALLDSGLGDRDLYLFDTFTGMPAPTSRDVSAFSGRPAAEILGRFAPRKGRSAWCIADKEDVAENLASTGYPAERVHLVAGKVEDTIPAHAPAQISLLRLDTDWYESTRHELTHLYQRLASGGVLIIDDYGYWEGARRATDEFLAGLPRPPVLHRIDCTGRFCLKP